MTHHTVNDLIGGGVAPGIARKVIAPGKAPIVIGASTVTRGGLIVGCLLVHCLQPVSNLLDHISIGSVLVSRRVTITA